jgi:hypothetical protein
VSAKGSLVVRFEGATELEAAFNALALSAQKKVFRAALRAGGKVLLKAIKARVPKRTGNLAKAIKLRASGRSRKRFGVAVFVDNKLIPLRKGEQQHNREGFYPAHLELGYVRGGTRLRTDWTGHGVDRLGRPYTRRRVTKTVVGGTVIPPRSFIRAGFDASKEDALRAIEAEAGRRMEIIYQKPKAAETLDEGGD